MGRQFHWTRFAADYQTQAYETVLAVLGIGKNQNAAAANQTGAPLAPGKEAA
jgi:hypothetical protein